LTTTVSLTEGVKENHTLLAVGPHAVGSSPAAVAAVVSSVVVNGVVETTVAWSKSSLAGGPAAKAGPARRTTSDKAAASVTANRDPFVRDVIAWPTLLLSPLRAKPAVRTSE